MDKCHGFIPMGAAARSIGFDEYLATLMDYKNLSCRKKVNGMRSIMPHSLCQLKYMPAYQQFMCCYTPCNQGEIY